MISKIIEALKAGRLAAFPTETVWGLACDPAVTGAIEAVYRAKGRDEGKPLVWMTDSLERLHESLIIPEKYRAEINKHWPGALTVIFAKKYGGTQGVRIPAVKELLELFQAYGQPIAVTSANRSGEKEAGSALEVSRLFADAVVWDFPVISSGQASTVIDLSAFEPKILRQGSVIFKID